MTHNFKSRLGILFMNYKIIEMEKKGTLGFVSIICMILFSTFTAFGQEPEKNEEFTKLLLGENKNAQSHDIKHAKKIIKEILSQKDRGKT